MKLLTELSGLLALISALAAGIYLGCWATCIKHDIPLEHPFLRDAAGCAGLAVLCTVWFINGGPF